MKTSQSIIHTSVTRLVIGVTLLFGVLLVLAVGHQMLEQAALNADETQYYLQVVEHKKKTYSTPGTPKDVTRLFGTNLYYSRKKGLFYRQTTIKKGVDYILWQRMNDQVNILIRIILITICLMIAVVVLVPIYVRRLSARLTAPLRDLSGAATNLRDTKQDQLALPVPDQPAEVHQLAVSFNQLLAELRRRQDLQRSFTLNATHELKTPIATVVANAQLLSRHHADHPEILEPTLATIEDAAKQMQVLVEGLLDLVRADQDRLPMEPVNLAETLEGPIAKLGEVAKREIAVDIPANLTALANPTATTQIVKNLLQNALKYAPAPAAISVRAAAAGDQVHLTVADTGPGIAPEDRPHVLERFYRSAAVRGQTNGTGLGLAIAKSERFFDRHGAVAIFLGRFIPVIRTVIPFTAGMGKMHYRTFAAFNALGGLAWVSVTLLAGYFFGQLPLVRTHFELIMLAIVAISLIPVAIATLKKGGATNA